MGRLVQSLGGRTSGIGMTRRSLALHRLKAVVVVELVTLVMSLALVLLPRRGSGELIQLPPDASTYFHRVLICFGLINGILVALALGCWLYWVAKGRPSSVVDEATEAPPSSDS